MTERPYQPEALTIGHSNLDAGRFVQLLRTHAVDVVIDTRSHPFSNHVPHFDMPELKALLGSNGMRYVYLGKELGGRPGDQKMYDTDGYVLYWRVAATAEFQKGIEVVSSTARRNRLALLCAEEDPVGCHRRLLVGRVLREKGLAVSHIRADGTLEPEESVRERESELQQIPLFGSEEREWKSSLSVLRRSRLRSSSEA
jgi:uncharacterized protein (DUF488 family)